VTISISVSIPERDFIEACPFVTEGMDKWEEQEARQMWRDALNDLEQTIGCAVRLHDQLTSGDDRAMRNGFGGMGGNIAHGYAITAELAIVQLRRIVDGAHHRVVVDDRRSGVTPSMPSTPTPPAGEQ